VMVGSALAVPKCVGRPPGPSSIVKLIKPAWPKLNSTTPACRPENCISAMSNMVGIWGGSGVTGGTMRVIPIPAEDMVTPSRRGGVGTRELKATIPPPKSGVSAKRNKFTLSIMMDVPGG